VVELIGKEENIQFEAKEGEPPNLPEEVELTKLVWSKEQSCEENFDKNM
jgi:hypothetical protein